MSQTIAIGIDLGTTNSSIAICRDGVVEIVKKPGGVEYTPSVFGFDKAKNKVVGQRAYDALYGDSAEGEARNYKPEVKRLMGTPETFFFERAGLHMKAEEISAEILSSLKQDVLRKYQTFDVSAAVITMPAAFSVLQCEATKRAGELAGFKHVVLLQEPIAAAISYGFGTAKSENWLVYDLGGGTFDVALISSSEGVLSVLAHSGDNFLGGKNFDWEIAEQIIAPNIRANFALADFRRDNPAHATKFMRLKYLAERAKIELSQYETTVVEVDDLGVDSTGKPITLAITVSRQQMEAAIRPLVDRTIELCRDTLMEAGLDAAAVSRVVLVGGPTQIPYITNRLRHDLGAVVDASVDPLTVVARGACIFAMGQRIPTDVARAATPVPAGTFAVTLNYEALTAEPVQTVTGVIHGLDPKKDHFLQIQSDAGTFSTPKMRLNNGKFFAQLELQRNRSNVFWVYLFDGQGGSLPLSPDSLSITHGLSIAGAPLPHSIGVAVARKGLNASEAFERLIEKGSVLPAKRVETFKTVRALRKGARENPLWIRVGEGESPIPDRNAFVCELGIRGSDLPRDLPEGTPVQLTVEVNEMRELLVRAYFPDIDLALDARSTFVDELLDVDEIERELDGQLERAHAASKNLTDEQAAKIDSAIRATSASIGNARVDQDEKRQAAKQLKDLKAILDRAQKESEWPQLKKDFASGVAETREVIAELTERADGEKLSSHLDEIEAEGNAAIAANDKTLLVNVTERLRELTSKAIHANPSTWVYHFQRLSDGTVHYANAKEAAYHIAKGRAAIAADDVEELKRCCRNLAGMLAPAERLPVARNLSGITR